MITSFKVRNIKFITYEINKFVMIFIYFFDKNKNEKFVFVCIIRKAHLIDDFKVNMLIENDILNFESFIINVNKRSTIINNCEMITKLFIKQRNLFVRRNVLFNNKIIVSFDI